MASILMQLKLAALTTLALVLVNILALEAETQNTTTYQSDLATCLIRSGVNFSVPSPGGGAASSYSALLSFSIQNLRFSGPSLPKPAAIVLPHTKRHLRNAIACCRRAKLAVRIRSGGHSYEGLSYLAARRTPFAVVDLMNMSRVWIEPHGSGSIWAESGATLGHIYHAIAGYSGTLALSAGSCPTVGSGGHIAGGGFGLLSRKYGLAADNVADAILIDYRGRVLTRETMGEEVFWAIRGGGGGAWGAVYAWKLRLRPVPKTVTSFIVNRPGSTEQVAGLIHRWQLVAAGLPDEFYLSCFVGATLPESNRTGLSTTFKGFFLGPAREAVSILGRAFPQLEIDEADCRETSWIESVVFFSGLKEGASVSNLLDRELHSKTFFKAKSDYVQSSISLGDLISAVHFLSTEPRAYLILDPYGGAMDRIRGDHLPFPHRRGNLYAIQYLVEWTDGQDPKSEEYIQWLRNFYGFMGRFVSKGPRRAYVNYLDLDLGTAGPTNGGEGRSDAVAEARIWGERYFSGNYDRLVRAKTAIDPYNVFSNVQSIPPLSSNLCSKSDSSSSSDSARSIL